MKILHDKMLEEIQKKQLNSTELSVFTPTGALGKKATKKERVRQAFYKEKLGMKLNEEEDNQFLTAKENAEEIVRSVDYDVWLCNHCGATEVYAFPNKESHYAECPRCHAHTYALESDRIITPATPFQSGLGEKRYRCRHCHFENVVPYTLPIIITPIIGGGGRGGGFGGGHFGGGFGGGLSGGGGSTSSW